MKKQFPKWLEFLIGPPLHFLGWIGKTFQHNRERIRRFKESPRVAVMIRYAAVGILLIWAVIWLIAPEERRNALTEAFKSGFSNLQSGTGNQQQP